MENKTAVEWLIEKIEQYILTFGNLPLNILNEFRKQAKEMEKNQIIDFGNDLLARNDINYIAVPDLSEQYYNETFNK